MWNVDNFGLLRPGFEDEDDDEDDYEAPRELQRDLAVSLSPAHDHAEGVR